ncbi:helix-turn-helix domain-containing protein [Lachnospiraceae bacterium AM48-27BH]|nr:helix-turn-helix domain-containing protein [Lachnospiraceae bacterium AM48-27BH]
MSGLSQQAFSEKYSIPKRSIENWETGKRVPPIYLLLLLERVVKKNFQTLETQQKVENPKWQKDK